MNHKKSSFFESWQFVLLTNFLIFFLVRTILVSDCMLSLSMIVALVVSILFLEKKDYINFLFTVYNRHTTFAFISGVFLLAFVLPISFTNQNYVAHIMCMAVIYAIACLGLNFQMGSTDMTNFAPAAFMGIGAYSVAVCTVKFGISAWVGLLAGIVLSGIFGLLIGLPTLRTKGYYLSLITMATQIAFTELLRNIRYLGGSDGISGIGRFGIEFIKLKNGDPFVFYKKYTVFGIKFAPQIPYLILCAFILVLLAYIAIRIYHSRIGLSLNVIAQDQTTANCMGINVTKQKLFAFIIGGIYCGIAGSLYAGLNSYAGPNEFNFSKSLMLICMVILGGMDNSIGIIVGAFLLTIISEKLRDFADFQQLAYGLILVIMLIFRPKGIIPKRVREYGDNVLKLLSNNNLNENLEE